MATPIQEGWAIAANSPAYLTDYVKYHIISHTSNARQAETADLARNFEDGFRGLSVGNTA